MNRTLIVAIAVGLATVASVIVWIARPEGPASQNEPASSITPSGIHAMPDEDEDEDEDEADRAAHRERFFGGDPHRDVRGGQEMRPQW